MSATLGGLFLDRSIRVYSFRPLSSHSVYLQSIGLLLRPLQSGGALEIAAGWAGGSACGFCHVRKCGVP